MEALVGAQKTGLGQGIANWCEVVAPDACSFLALKECWLHEEVATKDRDKIWCQPFHQVYATATVRT
jgi:hypothetical protein